MNSLIIRNRVIDEDPMKILYDLQSELHNGKLSEFKISGNSIAVTCPIHSDGLEHHPSCFINLNNEDVDYLYVHCFTCGYSASFAKFIGNCFNKSESFGEEWLINRYASDYVRDEVNLLKIDLNDNEEKVTTLLDESILDTFESYHPYMTQRKLTDEVIEKFKIKYDKDTKCIVFPLRDKHGKLVGLTKRSVEGKRFYYDKIAGKENMYCLNEVIDKDDVIICESQINCLTLWGWGYNAIATYGAGITNEQIRELNKTGIRHFILALDNDQAGWKGTNKLLSSLSKSKFIDVIKFKDSRDINDLTKEEFDELYREAVDNGKNILL